MTSVRNTVTNHGFNLVCWSLSAVKLPGEAKQNNLPPEYGQPIDAGDIISPQQIFSQLCQTWKMPLLNLKARNNLEHWVYKKTAQVCFLSGNITQLVFLAGKPTRLQVEWVSQAKKTTMTLRRQERWRHFGPLLGARQYPCNTTMWSGRISHG
jgi:hypothetical protein